MKGFGPVIIVFEFLNLGVAVTPFVGPGMVMTIDRSMPPMPVFVSKTVRRTIMMAFVVFMLVPVPRAIVMTLIECVLEPVCRAMKIPPVKMTRAALMDTIAVKMVTPVIIMVLIPIAAVPPSITASFASCPGLTGQCHQKSD